MKTMKKIKFTLTAFCSVFTFLCLPISCSSDIENDYIEHQNYNNSEELIKYNEAKENAKQKINDIYHALGGKHLRSKSENIDIYELIEHLINIPSEELDSMKKIYCNAILEEQYESASIQLLNIMISLTSVDKVAEFNTFVEEYKTSYINCHEFLYKNLEGKDQLIQSWMIRAAAVMDLVYRDFPNTRSYADKRCLSQCITSLSTSMVTDAIVDEIVLALQTIPGVDIISALCDAGYDLYSALQIAAEYNNCIYKTYHRGMN